MRLIVLLKFYRRSGSALLAVLLAFSVFAPHAHAAKDPSCLRSGLREISEPNPSRSDLLRSAARQAKGKYKQFAEQRYEAEGVRALSALEKLNPKWQVLVTDPGLMFRVDEFVKFANSKKLTDLGPWEAREVFSQHLGDRVVYRGIAITGDEAAEIQKLGMGSGALRQDLDILNSPYSLYIEVMNRLAGVTKTDRLLSVSDYPDLAAAVAKRHGFGRMGYRPGLDRGVYVFKLKVPELDLIYLEKGHPFLPLPKSAEKNMISVRNPKGKVSASYPLDRKVESFVFFRAEPSEILEVKRVETPPDYNWED